MEGPAARRPGARRVGLTKSPHRAVAWANWVEAEAGIASGRYADTGVGSVVLPWFLSNRPVLDLPQESAHLVPKRAEFAQPKRPAMQLDPQAEEKRSEVLGLHSRALLRRRETMSSRRRPKRRVVRSSSRGRPHLSAPPGYFWCRMPPRRDAWAHGRLTPP